MTLFVQFTSLQNETRPSNLVLMQNLITGKSKLMMENRWSCIVCQLTFTNYTSLLSIKT